VPQDTVAWQALLTDAFREARQALVQRAEEEEISPRAFATTLTCAVASDEWLVVGQVGDGIVVAKGENGDLFAATQPQRGEYANETFFLTMDEALQQIQVAVYGQSVDALAVMTDGLMRLAMNLAKSEPFSPFFEPLMAYAAQAENEAEAQGQLSALLASDRVCERTDDDKTLVLVARPSVSVLEAQPAAEARTTDAD
jgi:hypothetical protein